MFGIRSPGGGVRLLVEAVGMRGRQLVTRKKLLVARGKLKGC